MITIISAHHIELRVFHTLLAVYLRQAARLAASTLPALVVAVATFLTPLRALAASEGADPTSLRFVTPGEMKSGALLLQSTQEGRYVEAPQLGTDVDLVVSGPTIRARITQIFQNPTEAWVEAVYVYPLPDGGAVDTMKMVVGDRVVVADIKERQQARVATSRRKRPARRPL